MPLDSHYTLDKLEAGVDEVARGCLAGPVFAAAVIWPRDLELEIGNENTIVLKDSKKLTRTQRNNLREYIEAYAIDYAVASVNNQEIDFTWEKVGDWIDVEGMDVFNESMEIFTESLAKITPEKKKKGKK